MRQTRPGGVVVRETEELNEAAETRWAVAVGATVKVVSMALVGVALEAAVSEGGEEEVVPEGSVSTRALAALRCRGPYNGTSAHPCRTRRSWSRCWRRSPVRGQDLIAHSTAPPPRSTWSRSSRFATRGLCIRTGSAGSNDPTFRAAKCPS